MHRFAPDCVCVCAGVPSGVVVISVLYVGYLCPDPSELKHGGLS